MRAIKIFLLLGIGFGLNGCLSTTQNYYVLSMVSQPANTYTLNKHILGVGKISVPGYMYKRDIAIAKSSSQITLLGHALWGEDLDRGLTNRLIGFLQKKFNQPEVYTYPWGVDKQPDIKVSVQITRFIAQGDFVYLDATWSLEDLKSKKRKARLFTVKIPTSTEVDSIVKSMDIAFGKFEETVAVGINNF